jgi:hypothetical protein
MLDYNTKFCQVHIITQKRRWLKSTQNGTKAQVAQKDTSQKLSSVWVLLLLHQVPPLLLLM